MSNPDGIEGIGGDRNFIDHLYLYYKLNKEISLNENNPKKEDIERSSCENYLHAINQCLTKIQNLPDNDDIKHSYLNWLRWNIDVIIAQLDNYQSTKHLITLVPAISNCKNNIRIVAEHHFQLSESEKAISNQYIHAYQRVFRTENCSENVYKHTGKLYINYINLLKNRFYIQKLDRDGVTFVHLEAEADYMVNKLKGVDEDLASSIKEITELYAQIRLMDDGLRHNEDENVKKALILAHIRSQESFFQTVRRQTREAIFLIKKKLTENIKKAWDSSSVVFNPILHPIDCLKDMWYCVTHPLESVKAICNYVKENPWKSALVVLGGLCIGVATGAGIFLAGAKLASFTLSSLVIPKVSLTVFGGIGGALGGALLPTAIAGGKVVKLKDDSNEKIKLENDKEKVSLAVLEAKYKEEGLGIAKQVLYEEHRRQMFKEAQKIAEENIRKIQKEEECIEEERRRQIDSMTAEELEQTHGQLVSAEDEMVTSLKDIQTELIQKQMEFRQSQADIFKVREGLLALSRLMQNVEKRTGLPSEQLNNSD